MKATCAASLQSFDAYKCPDACQPNSVSLDRAKHAPIAEFLSIHWNWVACIIIFPQEQETTFSFERGQNSAHDNNANGCNTVCELNQLD